MDVAIVGCAHGELDDIYSTIGYINSNPEESSSSTEIKLLICCGDFQAVRNNVDLNCLACPPKYRKLGPFADYYHGRKVAPVMTIFIGGNHEASNYLQDLHYGGYVAPNIFYLGTAGVINYGGLRIGGISGIYKSHDYTKGHFEKFPYDNSTMRSVYHVREFDIFQLSHISNHLDIAISHDWPRGIAQHGNVQDLLRKKSFLKEEVQSNTLGNPATEFLLHKLQPSYWFSGHLHVKFAAIVNHTESKCTKFLALDKCLPRKQFLQVLHFENSTKDKGLEVDLQWLATLRATHHLASREKFPKERVPTSEIEIEDRDIEFVRNAVTTLNASKNSTSSPLAWPTEFCVTSLDDDGGSSIGNPQTDQLLAMLKLPHVVTDPYTVEKDPNALDIDSC